jgi:hypothetical protein
LGREAGPAGGPAGRRRPRGPARRSHRLGSPPPRLAPAGDHPDPHRQPARNTPSSGDDGLPEAFVQADCWGESPEQADDLATAVRAFCGRARPETTAGKLQGVFIESARDFDEGESPEPIFRTTLTLQVWRPDP